MYSIESIKKCLSPVLGAYNINSAILFGSYAKNTVVENSDIDICVDSGLKGMLFYGLLEDVCNAVDCSVDMIDIRDIEAGTPIYNEIQKSGVKIYDRT